MKNQFFYPQVRWNAFNKFLLRFVLIFFGLLCLPLLGFIGSDIYPWIARTFFSINEMGVEATGSGDMYYYYMEVFFAFMVALIIGGIWSAFNKIEKGYDSLLHYFLIFLRYYLAFTLLGYGYNKVFCLQFPPPSLNRLLQPYGDSSPMGIVWTFMGSSKAYTMFSGWAEVIAGALLLFRRTTALGALIGFVVMFNVMVLNFCYDIPVKLYSTQLVIMLLIVLYFKAINLKHVLFTHKAGTSMVFKPMFTKKWLRISRVCIKSLVVFYLVVFTCYQQYGSVAEYGDDAPKPKLYGIYKPQQLIVNGDTLRTYSDSAEWKYLVIDKLGNASIRQMNDRRIRLFFEEDTLKKTFAIQEETDTINKYQFSYVLLNDSVMTIKGLYKKDTINFTLGKVNLNSFRLLNRGFNWVNEYPYNR